MNGTGLQGVSQYAVLEVIAMGRVSGQETQTWGDGWENKKWGRDMRDLTENSAGLVY